MSGGAAPPTPPAASPSYSRAFETFVQDPDDLVGLLAYSLYKRHIREAFLADRPHPSDRRTPTDTELAAFRGDAERRLQTFAASAIDQASPEIVQGSIARSVESITGVVDQAKTEIVRAVERRTSLGPAIAANVLGWAVTLALTVLVITGIYLPNWAGDLVDRLRGTTTSTPPVSGQSNR